MFKDFEFDKSRFNSGNEIKMFKLAFLGISGSGKTTIINQYINNSFIKNHIPTNDAM
jgi:GTPase SAR1 family protein